MRTILNRSGIAGVMNRRRAGAVLAAVAAVVLAAAGAEAQRDEDVQVLLSPQQALQEIFPAAAAFTEREFRPSAEQRAALERELGRPLYEPSYPFLAVFDAGRRFLGYALVTEERGKYRPITFMVGVTPDVRVQDVAVMVYRESRGGEVQRRRFLSQYRGKGLRNPIAINRDIINISGATISVRSMNAGVRKTLALVQQAFGRQQPSVAAGGLRPVGSLR